MTSCKISPTAFIGILAASILLCGLLMEVEGEDMKDMEAGELMTGEGSVFGCDRCGNQCKLKCGTRRFRSCCLHFLRKRSPSSKKLYHDARIKQNLQQQQQLQLQSQLQPLSYKTTGSVETSFQELLAHLISLSESGSGNPPGSAESDYGPNDTFP